jgi:hypothetical protein
MLKKHEFTYAVLNMFNNSIQSHDDREMIGTINFSYNDKEGAYIQYEIKLYKGDLSISNYNKNVPWGNPGKWIVRMREDEVNNLIFFLLNNTKEFSLNISIRNNNGIMNDAGFIANDLYMVNKGGNKYHLIKKEVIPESFGYPDFERRTS